MEVGGVSIVRELPLPSVDSFHRPWGRLYHPWVVSYVRGGASASEGDLPPKKDPPYCFYFDDVFTSIGLLNHLCSKECGGSCTMPENRVDKTFNMYGSWIMKLILKELTRLQNRNFAQYYCRKFGVSPSRPRRVG